MPLPFSLTGHVFVPEVSDAHRATSRLEAALWAGRARHVRRAGAHLRFGGGLYGRLGRVNLRASVTPGAGEITVRPTEGGGVVVLYTLRFARLVFGVSAGVLLSAPFVLAASNLSRWEGAEVLARVWLSLYGVNVAAAYRRFPKWVRRTLQPDL